MLKRLLIALGLRSAPTPIRSYLWASSFVGTVPALAYLGWKYRGKILPALKRAEPRFLRRESPAVQPSY